MFRGTRRLVVDVEFQGSSFLPLTSKNSIRYTVFGMLCELQLLFRTEMRAVHDSRSRIPQNPTLSRRQEERCVHLHTSWYRGAASYSPKSCLMIQRRPPSSLLRIPIDPFRSPRCHNVRFSRFLTMLSIAYLTCSCLQDSCRVLVAGSRIVIEVDLCPRA